MLRIRQASETSKTYSPGDLLAGDLGRNPDVGRRIVGAAGLGAVVLVAGLSACSSKSEPASRARSTPASSTTTVMMEQHTHMITGGVDCATSASQPSATPSESGDLTTRISAHDDSATLSVALSDETPPTVDAFAISLNTASGQYRMPYQAPQSATQVQAIKEGKSYTVTGSGQGVSPGQGDVHQVTFGIHVTCP